MALQRRLPNFAIIYLINFGIAFDDIISDTCGAAISNCEECTPPNGEVPKCTRCNRFVKITDADTCEGQWCVPTHQTTKYDNAYSVLCFPHQMWLTNICFVY